MNDPRLDSILAAIPPRLVCLINERTLDHARTAMRVYWQQFGIIPADWDTAPDPPPS